jgi:hypothetical protein
MLLGWMKQGKKPHKLRRRVMLDIQCVVLVCCNADNAHVTINLTTSRWLDKAFYLLTVYTPPPQITCCRDMLIRWKGKSSRIYVVSVKVMPHVDYIPRCT